MTGTEERRRSLRGLIGSNRRLILGAVSFVAVLVVWEAAADFGLVRRSLLSAPSDVLATAVADVSSGYIFPQIGTSALEYVVGFGLAFVIGVPLGFVIGLSPVLYEFVDPWISAMYATPIVALIPLIILLFGIGFGAKIVVVLLLAVFVLLVNVVAGVHSVDKRFEDVATSFGASRWLRFRSVTLPCTLPFIITGVRNGGAHALVGVIVGEFIVANQGIGYYISQAGVTLNTARVMLGIVLLALFGLAFGELVRKLEERVSAWRPALNE